MIFSDFLWSNTFSGITELEPSWVSILVGDFRRAQSFSSGLGRTGLTGVAAAEKVGLG